MIRDSALIYFNCNSRGLNLPPYLRLHIAFKFVRGYLPILIAAELTDGIPVEARSRPSKSSCHDLWLVAEAILWAAYGSKGTAGRYVSAMWELASSRTHAAVCSCSGNGRMSGFCMITRAQVFHRRIASSFPGTAKFMAFS